MVRSSSGLINRRNSTSGNVSMNALLSNIKYVTISMTAGNLSRSITRECTVSSVSENGLTAQTDLSEMLSTTFGNNSLTNKNNFFRLGGDKTITVTAETTSGSEITLFTVNLFKNYSYENFIMSTKFGRYDYSSTDGEDTYNSNYTVIDPYIVSGDYVNSEFNNIQTSVLASPEKLSSVKPEIPAWNIFGNTTYPVSYTYTYDITAENGDNHIYTMNTAFPTVKSVAVSNISSENKTVNDIYICDKGKLPKLTILYDSSSVLFNKTQSNIKYNSSFVKALIKINGKEFGTYYPANSDPTTISVPEWNTYLKLSTENNSIELSCSDISNVPLGVITVEPVIAYNTSIDSKHAVFQLDGFNYATQLLSDSRLKNVNWKNAVAASAISSESSELSYDCDINANGDIIYTEEAKDKNYFYIYNTVENYTNSDILSLKAPLFGTIEKYNESTGKWEEVFKSTSSSKVFYQENIDYTKCRFVNNEYISKYRIKAQDYDKSDAEKSTHISYYDLSVSKIARNKDLSVIVDLSDSKTSEFYNDIISKYGNLSVTIKNINKDSIKLQQTKFYISDKDAESKYYKLTQGDYAIAVQVPDEYTAKIKIDGGIGGSSEGYLRDSQTTKGKRLQLPYANEQSVRLIVTLEKTETSYDKSIWGIEYFSSLFTHFNKNNI